MRYTRCDGVWIAEPITAKPAARDPRQMAGHKTQQRRNEVYFRLPVNIDTIFISVNNTPKPR
jgi:hypothetical protein